MSDAAGRYPFTMPYGWFAVSETDERAEQEYGEHLEYNFRKGLGSVPMEKLALPGNIDIRGVQALLKDPGDFGLYNDMKTATYRDLVEAGVVVAGSPGTVRDQLIDFCRDYGIGNLHAMLGFGSLPRHLVMKNIQLFSEEVLPHLRDLVPASVLDGGVEDEAVEDAGGVGGPADVGLDLRLGGEGPRPVRVQRERVGVQLRRHVARRAGVGVVAPGATHVRAALDDEEVAEVLVPELDRHREATEAGADHEGAHVGGEGRVRVHATTVGNLLNARQ